MFHIEWRNLSEAYAFFGNSLLAPMTQTSSVGLDRTFWEAFPDFGSADVRAAAEACAGFARKAQAACEAEGKDAVERCAVEYTKLFIGPPKPAAAPWETMYRDAKAQIGFGGPTIQMRALLREAGLAVSNDNRQYEDHMGLELLFLSTLCARMSEAASGSGCSASDDAELVPTAEFVARFVDEHPLGWIADFQEAVAASRPGCYFDHLLAVASAVLRGHRAALAHIIEEA